MEITKLKTESYDYLINEIKCKLCDSSLNITNINFRKNDKEIFDLD